MTLVAALTIGLVWQFVLVMALIAHERRSLRWAVLRDALWLRPPSDSTGRRGGRLWLWALVFAVGYGVLQLVPLGVPEPSDRSFGKFMSSTEGQDIFHGNWGLFGLVVIMFLFNTVLGEELLFRGLLLPRMRGAFGKADWIANGVLSALYHLHQPWSIPRSLIANVFLFAYPARRFQSAWMSILVHSLTSVVFTGVLFALVIS